MTTATCVSIKLKGKSRETNSTKHVGSNFCFRRNISKKVFSEPESLVNVP